MKAEKVSAKAKGTQQEQLACRYLASLGCEILQSNYRFSGGEIDLIFKEEEILVFCEVKYRKTEFLEGYFGVLPSKQRRISQGAFTYLAQCETQDADCRFDVICIVGTKLRHIRNAFLFQDIGG